MNKEEIKVLEHCLQFYKKFCEEEGLQPIITGIEAKALERLLENYKMLQQENQQLKEELKTKHNGFMASIEESCDLAKEVDLWNNKYNLEYNIRMEYGERINKCLDLLSHFNEGQECETSARLVHEIKVILNGE